MTKKPQKKVGFFKKHRNVFLVIGSILIGFVWLTFLIFARKMALVLSILIGIILAVVIGWFYRNFFNTKEELEIPINQQSNVPIELMDLGSCISYCRKNINNTKRLIHFNWLIIFISVLAGICILVTLGLKYAELQEDMYKALLGLGITFIVVIPTIPGKSFNSLYKEINKFEYIHAELNRLDNFEEKSNIERFYRLRDRYEEYLK